jgi:rhodanese-related sulfurtransferase
MFGQPRVPSTDVSAITDETFLLDVREADEWQAGRAPNAVHAPMSSIQQNLASIPTDRQIVVVCRVGGRSEQVTAWLVSQDYDALNLSGGMLAWAASGRPVVNDAGNDAFVL